MSTTAEIAAELRQIAARVEALTPPAPPPPVEPPPVEPPPVEPPPVEPPPVEPPVGGNLWQYVTHDDGTGPSRDDWSKQANIHWQRAMGDWLDAAGVMWGPAPFASVSVPTVGPLSMSIDPQVMRHGVMLTCDGTGSASVTLGGRLSATPPTMTVTLADGTQRVLPCLSLARWDSSTHKALDSRQAAKASQTSNLAAVFDIPADAVSAVLNLHAVTRYGTQAWLRAFALRPPGISLPRQEQPPTLGIAAAVQNEDDLRGHPLVIAAADWSDMRTVKQGGPMWTGLQLSDNADAQAIDDATAPGGGKVLRARFRSRYELANALSQTLAWADQNGRGAMSATCEMSPANLDDPLRSPANVVPEAYLRVYFMLEDDWRATNDANKAAIGWDMRYGWWSDSGYWQQTTGNGGSRGSGLKKVIAAGTYTGQKREQYVYEGHSIRMEFGIGPTDPAHPFDALRPVQSYVYSLDQFDFNGRIERHGNAMIERGRWHCIEQHIRMNSVRPMTPWDHEWEAQQVRDGWLPASRLFLPYTDGYDDLGNGGAAPDGLMETWLDGVLIDRRDNMRWRRHPEMGVGSPWINWFFGGKQAANVEQHFRMGRVVLARAYIGPHVG